MTTTATNNQNLTFTEKMKMAYEIHMVMAYLGIPAEDFLKMKDQHGGLQGLYNWAEREIAASDEPITGTSKTK